MRAIEFVAESHEHGVVSKRYLYGAGTNPVAVIEIDKHAIDRMEREGYRPIRDSELERVLGKVSRNLERILTTIAPPQVCSIYDEQTNVACLIQCKSPYRRGGPIRLVVTTMTPGRMWGREFREEIDLR